MKTVSNLIILLLAAIVTDISIVDSDGDRSKSIILIDYSDGTTDKLVVDKQLILTKDPALDRAVMNVIESHGGK